MERKKIWYQILDVPLLSYIMLTKNKPCMSMLKESSQTTVPSVSSQRIHMKCMLTTHSHHHREGPVVLRWLCSYKTVFLFSLPPASSNYWLFVLLPRPLKLIFFLISFPSHPKSSQSMANLFQSL